MTALQTGLAPRNVRAMLGRQMERSHSRHQRDQVIFEQDATMDQQTTSKPDWALSRRERKRQALLAAGIEPRRVPWKIIGGVVVVGVAAAFVLPMLAGPQASTTTEVAEPASPVTKQILSVDVATAEVGKLSEVLKATGSLAPRRTVALTSQVNGTVKDVPVRVGDQVKAGETLVAVDVETSEIQLRQQKATASATRAQLAQAESQLERSLGLAERGLTPNATVESERSSIAALKANLEALEAGVAAAEVSIRNATITAPFDGVVAARSVEPGQVVGAGAALVQVVDLSAMEMTAYVPVSASPQLKAGQRVTLTVEGLGGRTFDGAVEGISPVAAQGTRTVPVLVSIANPDGVLRGGMFATGQIVTDEVDSALAIPTAAIREDDGGQHVLVIADGKLHRRTVETTRTWNGTKVQLADGLEAGAVFVSGRLDDLEAGMNVTVVEN